MLELVASANYSSVLSHNLGVYRMPVRHLPPFAALRAFEATARSLSFTRAAEDLGVSQAAVSRQVGKLERHLGLRLIERHPTGNELTRAGQTLATALRDSLDAIEAALRTVSPNPSRDVVTVSVAPFFSAVWLTPRIMRFIDANPGVDLRLHHSYQPPDYRRDHVDLGINWGSGEWSGVTALKVFDGTLSPVCSPDLRGNLEAITKPDDLLAQPLFYEFHERDWVNWFAAAGLDVAGRVTPTRLDDTNALRRAALAGHGVALFITSLAEEDLALGRLVQPFDIAVDTGDHYFLNHPSDRELPAAAKRFRRWLLRELENGDGQPPLS